MFYNFFAFDSLKSSNTTFVSNFMFDSNELSIFKALLESFGLLAVYNPSFNFYLFFYLLFSFTY